MTKNSSLNNTYVLHTFIPLLIGFLVYSSAILLNASLESLLRNGVLEIELAEFEKMDNEPGVSIEDLHRDGGFLSPSDPAIFACFIAEAVNDGNRTAAGYAIAFTGYSTWLGRTLKLKDLYVKDGYRNLNIGRRLIKAIAEHAKEVNASRLYFHVLEWNTSARRFYESLGATNWTESEEWALLRFDKNAIDSLVNTKMVK